MNGHRIAAVVGLTWREAIRSRVVLSLLVALALVLVGLPMLVEGDGTAAGRLRIILEYALAAAVALLSAATLWAGCASVAVEADDRRLFVVLAKPLRRWELWLGKWMGIVLLDALALLVTGGIVVASVALNRPAGADADVDALLSARRVLVPVWPEPPASHAEGAPAPHVLAVPPGGSASMAFAVPAGFVPTGPLELRARVASSRPERTVMESRWLAGPASAPLATVTVTNYPGMPLSVRFPPTVCEADGVRIRVENSEQRDPATLMLSTHSRSVELLAPQGGFVPNLVRGLLIVLARLAFLAALGVTAGCLLSLPVAVFVSVFVLVLLASAGYVETVSVTGAFYIPHEGGMPELTWLDRSIIQVFRGMNLVTRPLLRLDPVPLLSDGRRVTWDQVGQALGLIGTAYVIVVAAFGTWRFTRREIGLSGAE